MTSDDLTDTVELPVLGEQQQARAQDDTDEFDLRATDNSQRMLAHAYADGVIRLYRARTIVLSERDSLRFDRAWRYLHRLRPQDLPPDTRPLFLELVYLMQEHAGRAIAIPYRFSEMVLAIGERIDLFVDEISRDIDDE